MVRKPPADDLPAGLVDRLLDGPVLRPDRIAAGRWRAFCGPVSAAVLASLLVEHGRGG